MLYFPFHLAYVLLSTRLVSLKKNQHRESLYSLKSIVCEMIENICCYYLKVGLSPCKRIRVICFIKMMKILLILFQKLFRSQDF